MEPSEQNKSPGSKELNELISNIRLCWRELSIKSQRQFYVLIGLIFVATLTEALSLGAVVPFIALLVTPEQVTDFFVFDVLFNERKDLSLNEIRIAMGVIFIAMILFSSAARLLMTWLQIRLIHTVSNELCSKAFLAALLKPYDEKLDVNNSEVAATIITKTNDVAYNVIQPFLNLISSVTVALGIIAIIFYFNPGATLAAAVFFALIFVCISFFSKEALTRDSKIMSLQADARMKSLLEALNSTTDITLNGFQYDSCANFQKNDLLMRIAVANVNIIAAWPRYIVEGLGITLIAIATLFVSLSDNGLLPHVPYFAALALSAQRILPLMQVSYQCFTTMRGSSHFLKGGMELIAAPVEHFDPANEEPLPFTDSIELKDVTFQFRGAETTIFNGLNLRITKGSIVGIVGKTGSGKSTLINLLMALLSPTNGALLVDGLEISSSVLRRRYQKSIAYVPQEIFISDTDILSNVAYCLPNHIPSEERAEAAISNARLDDYVTKQKVGLKFLVGDNGRRLSGGQRQRLSIARALYKDCEIIIFDEATSALDSLTEEEVFESLKSVLKGKTIIFITHRPTSLESADTVYRVENNGLLTQLR